MTKRILVTGGAGFIGSHIVDQLRAAGHSILVFDNLSSGNRANLPADIELIEGDIRQPALRAAVQKFSPQVVVHTAAQISVRVSMEDPMLDTEINLLGLVNILDSFKGKDLPYVVFLSSGGAIYGEQDCFPADEDHACRPASVYGLAKQVSEQYLELWKRCYGLSYCALRLANVYGPRQNPHGEAGVVAIFIKHLLAGKAPTINGSGQQTRDFVFVKDVARAVAKAVETQKSGTYNIGTGVESSVQQIYQIVSDRMQVGISALQGPAKAGEQQRSCISSARALKALDWQPMVSLSEGLQQTITWFMGQKRA
jgi:UDP-glucose 4-epimerase